MTPKMNADTSEALLHELNFLLKKDWIIHREPNRFRIGPLLVAEQDGTFRDEVWRIAQFVAYSDFVSITKDPGGGYTIVSTRESGSGFEVILQIMSRDLVDHRPRPFTEEEEAGQA